MRISELLGHAFKSRDTFKKQVFFRDIEICTHRDRQSNYLK